MFRLINTYYKSNNLGKNIDISGIKLISIKTITIISKNGSKGFMTWVTETLATPLPMKSKVLTGEYKSQYINLVQLQYQNVPDPYPMLLPLVKKLE